MSRVVEAKFHIGITDSSIGYHAPSKPYQEVWKKLCEGDEWYPKLDGMSHEYQVQGSWVEEFRGKLVLFSSEFPVIVFKVVVICEGQLVLYRLFGDSSIILEEKSYGTSKDRKSPKSPKVRMRNDISDLFRTPERTESPLYIEHLKGNLYLGTGNVVYRVRTVPSLGPFPIRPITVASIIGVLKKTNGHQVLSPPTDKDLKHLTQAPRHRNISVPYPRDIQALRSLGIQVHE